MTPQEQTQPDFYTWFLFIAAGFAAVVLTVIIASAALNPCACEEGYKSFNHESCATAGVWFCDCIPNDCNPGGHPHELLCANGTVRYV